ncbi:MAG TPA: RNA 2',3'-cyclic phosphodiesterase [Actinocrinis sp.]|jgi:2'-5' RNA ligase|uniref:RNA 2',3'-cyclic phosphodiesterase n=1 Tax=Actinocrinis sp. TaxID=1920516 RepID=UPI002DDCD918|nr:RNA 2',3'-cyclic phosphodiesterase [Actinocrinis sp.]HEV3172629.1 RNA 2',3'-cyclic phosphodiesterase [Actinocrinis sp.]
MRLFVAVIPPRPVVLELRAALTTLPHGDPQLRWCRPESWHVTLAFFGEVAEPALEDLKDRLGRAAGRNTPMELSLAGGGHFTGKALWTGVQGDRDRLGRLAESVAGVARRCHIKVDDRPFRPHLTLAHVRDSAGPVDLQPYVERMAGFRTPRWLVGEIDLFESVDDPLKRYNRIGRWALTGR